MMVVAEENRIERTDLVRSDRGARCLFMNDRAVRAFVFASRIERGIGEKPDPVVFDKDSRAAN